MKISTVPPIINIVEMAESRMAKFLQMVFSLIKNAILIQPALTNRVSAEHRGGRQHIRMADTVGCVTGLLYTTNPGTAYPATWTSNIPINR